MNLDRLFGMESDSPEPSWTSEFPNKAMKQAREFAKQSSLIAASLGYNFSKGKFGEEVVLKVCDELNDVSVTQLVRQSGMIKFYVLDADRSRILLPFRKQNLGTWEAKDVLSNVLIVATDRLTRQKLPVINLPPSNVHPFGSQY